jgi:hypothetical protein
MRLDYVISVTRKNGSRSVVHVYGQPTPQPGDVVALPLDGGWISAKIQTREANTAEAVAREI